MPANIDGARVDRFSFSSRKVPEYMHWRLVRCQCDTLYADPAPPAAVLQSAYASADYGSAEAAHYAAATYAKLIPRVLAGVPSGGGGLDIGAGDGAFLRELLRAGFSDVAGVEPSLAAAEAAEPDVRHLIRRDVFREADFEPSTFRLITAFQTLEHVPAPLDLCRSAFRLLSDGGAFAVVCHDRRAPLNRVLGRRSPIFDIEHLQLFSRRALGSLFARGGFVRIQMLPLVNRYPLRAWARYLPLAAGPKQRVLELLDGAIGGIGVPMPVGNVAVVGYKPGYRAARTAANT
jgi:SAM-dependent methyltransferase